MPTTFVLGAGASRDAGYPFAKDLGRGLLKWMDQAEPEGIRDFSSSATSLRETFENAENIEELLTQVDEVAALYNSPHLSARMQAARVNHDRQALIHGLRRWFEQIGRTPSDSYRLFAREVIQPGDSVKTFNYDVSLDIRTQTGWGVGSRRRLRLRGRGLACFLKSRSPQITWKHKLAGTDLWRPTSWSGRCFGTIFRPSPSLLRFRSKNAGV